MLGVDWANLGYAGTFVVGAVVGIVVTLRLARVLAQFFTELLRRGDEVDERHGPGAGDVGDVSDPGDVGR